jgi:DNA-binding transcriptional MerR regulator
MVWSPNASLRIGFGFGGAALTIRGSPMPLSSALRDFESSNEPSQEEPPAGELIGISEMARRFQTTYRTLRFYEARGLLKAHRDGVNRYYDVESQRQFRLIHEGRQLGFTLTEIAKLLSSSPSKDALELSLDTIADQIDHLEQQRLQIDDALATLRKRYYVMSGQDGTDTD